MAPSDRSVPRLLLAFGSGAESAHRGPPEAEFEIAFGRDDNRWRADFLVRHLLGVEL